MPPGRPHPSSVNRTGTSRPLRCTVVTRTHAASASPVHRSGSDSTSRLAAPGQVPDPHRVVAGGPHAGVRDADDRAVGVEREAGIGPGLCPSRRRTGPPPTGTVCTWGSGSRSASGPRSVKKRDRGAVGSDPQARGKPRAVRQPFRATTGRRHQVDVHRMLQQALGVEAPVDAAQHPRGRFALVALTRADRRGVVVGKHRQAPAVGQPGNLGNAVLERGQAQRLAAVERQDVELVRALVPVGQERQRAAVRREGRAASRLPRWWVRRRARPPANGTTQMLVRSLPSRTSRRV